MASSQVVPRGLAVVLALWLLIPGCDRGAPAARDSAVDSALAAARLSPQGEWVSTDDPRIGSHVGERRLGLGLATTGKSGWLMFGPYLSLPAGRYQVELQGSVQDGHAGVVHVDVAQAQGKDLLAAVELGAPDLLAPPSPDGIAVVPFELKAATGSLEVRVRVTDSSRLAISGFVVRALR